MSTLTYSENVSNELTRLVGHSFSLEKTVSDLKKVILILAKGMAMDENGNTTIILNHEEAEFIKNICDKHSVFGLGATK